MANPDRPRAADPIPGVPLEARPIRVALFVLTALTAAAALFLQPALAGAVHRGALPPVWLFLPVAVYGLFFLVYAADRWLLVRRRRYPPGRALFQIVFGLIFALLLLPSTIGDWSPPAPTDEARLLAHADPAVRRVAIEALGFRGFDPARLADVKARLDDPDPDVRAAATRVLSRWAGLPAASAMDLRNWNGTGARAATSTSSEGAR